MEAEKERKKITMIIIGPIKTALKSVFPEKFSLVLLQHCMAEWTARTDWLILHVCLPACLSKTLFEVTSSGEEFKSEIQVENEGIFRTSFIIIIIMILVCSLQTCTWPHNQ
jgi:hypothetical protein